MYLKSIEVHGFKSFANKIDFQFHNGITGIVGPNGSGKSNVADAVRWVLGEQRIKQLRGASMADVIFSGTELRKPLSYAYVAITLDNSDHQLAISYDEVTVARRIYRSGESEYILNGSVVRLKDINELFYDTGIGKEGYSIIGQGQIDRILSGKPEERRELFDEAAGIVKFKRRKNAAVAKLENEHANLVRVQDILAELEKQVGPLEKQSQTAKIYLRKKEALKTLDVNVFLLENARLKEQLALVDEKLAIAGAEFGTASAEYEEIKARYVEIEGQIEGLERSIEQARNTLSTAGLTREKLEGEIKVLEEQIHSAAESKAHFLNRKAAIEKDIAEKESQKEEILLDKKSSEEQIAEIEASAALAKAALKEVQDALTAESTAIEESKNTIISELNLRAQLKSRLERIDTTLEQEQVRGAQLDARLLRAKSDEAARLASISEYENRFDEVTARLGEQNKEVKAVEENLTKMRFALTKADENLRSFQAKFHQEKSKLDALTNIAERYEGYGNSVKRVMERKDTHAGIIGVVADIIRAEEKYEVAIETALGGNIQNIVTENEEIAKREITFLKEGKLGRATFLPLTSITKPQEFKTPEVLKEKGALGLACDLVSVDAGLENVAKAMLGRIVVVDSIDNAIQIAKKYDHGVRMVTLEGELFVPGGAISGGAFKNNSNLLGRRREIDAIEKELQKIRKEIAACNKEIEQTKEERNTLRVALESLKSEISKSSIEQNTIRLSLVQLRERKDEEEAGAQDILKERTEIKQRILALHADKEGAKEALAKSLETEAAMQAFIAEKTEVLDALRVEETKALAQVNDWDVKVEVTLAAGSFKQANLDRIEGEIVKSKKELEEVCLAMEGSEADVVFKKESITEIQKTIEASYQAETAARELLKGEISKKEVLNAKQKKFFDTREALAERIGNLDKELYRLNDQHARLENNIEGQINYMWNEYEITLRDAAALRSEEMTDLSGMKSQIGLIKEEIKKLGNVNVGAIEEYRALMERYDFLKTQHDDLISAQETLEKIIKELDASMRKQFSEKFAEIDKEFNKVFKELFGGGTATLELMEEEDILEAGVRIIAQPPGKKLQNMMQLSGGEKALTAISLLFAIQNLKPSPFCLLDEIEAALDDSNVGRFARYLHKLTKNTQFIVITHRRGTMEEVDRLYGITMQEKGVSTLVSVNLIDKDLTD